MAVKQSEKPDSSAIYKAYLETETTLKRFLRRFMSSSFDIEDVCQETIMRALEAERDREINEPRAFLFGVSKNIVRKRLDKQSKSLIDYIEDYSSQEHVSDSEISIESSLDDERKMQIFAEAVSTLPRQCQQVFVMKKVYGYSHKEIATKLNISISTTEKHVASGLKRCTDIMRKQMNIGSEKALSLFQDNENSYTGNGIRSATK